MNLKVVKNWVCSVGIMVVSYLGISTNKYQPLREIKGIPPGIERFDDGDNIIEVYEGGRYVRKAFDKNKDGLISPDEMTQARKEINDAFSSWYANTWKTKRNLNIILDSIELGQKIDERAVKPSQ